MERITDPRAKESIGHTFRYKLVTPFIYGGDDILDAACGIGYGEHILRDGAKFDMYYGIDILDPEYRLKFKDPYSSIHYKIDLTLTLPVLDFDIAIGFETLEHLDDYSKYIQTLKQAKEMVFMSVPIVPSKHVNHHHIHDFKFDDVIDLMVDDDWELYQALVQPLEVSGIYIFKRKGTDAR